MGEKESGVSSLECGVRSLSTTLTVLVNSTILEKSIKYMLLLLTLSIISYIYINNNSWQIKKSMVK